MTSKPYRTGKAASAAALGATLLLGACAKGDISTSGVPTDIRERHPIVLRDAPRSLDVFVGHAGGGLDPRVEAIVAGDPRARPEGSGTGEARRGKGGLSPCGTQLIRNPMRQTGSDGCAPPCWAQTTESFQPQAW